MYGKVSQDLAIAKGILEMALDKPIEGVSFAENQKIDPFGEELCKYTFENVYGNARIKAW